ncbi:hypothetical protein [Allorhodopirellula heiligendammensis]|nr:hypothetical protein [Allorhodopirellula heiligendammensis]
MDNSEPLAFFITWTVDGTVLQRESHEPCQIVEFLNRNDRIQN